MVTTIWVLVPAWKLPRRQLDFLTKVSGLEGEGAASGFLEISSIDNTLHLDQMVPPPCSVFYPMC